MALKLKVRRQEKLMINGAVLEFSNDAEVTFLNRASIMREKDVMVEDQVTDLWSAAYFIVQLIYIDIENKDRLGAMFRRVIGDLTDEYPEKREELNRLLTSFDEDNFYECLKLIKNSSVETKEGAV